jgi:hypothetical protein
MKIPGQRLIHKIYSRGSKTSSSTNYDIEAVKLDHARNAWPAGPVVAAAAAAGKVSKDGGRRHSIRCAKFNLGVSR